MTYELTGQGEHLIESFEDQAPGVTVDRDGASAFELTCPPGTVGVAFWGEAGTIEVSEGWVSERFGVREQAPILVVRTVVPLPVSFGYSFGPVA